MNKKELDQECRRLRRFRFPLIPLTSDEILEFLMVIAEKQQLHLKKVYRAKEALALAGFLIFIGTMLGGRTGTIIGILLGILAGFCTVSFSKPLWSVLPAMSQREKTRLTEFMRPTYEMLGITDALILLRIMNRPGRVITETIVIELGIHFEQVWHVRIDERW